MDLNTTTSPPEAAPMDFKTLAGLVHTLQTATIAALIFAVCAYIPKLKQRSQLSKLPTISGEGYLTNAKEKYKEGYQKFKDGVYRIATSDGEDNVVVPSSLLPELRKLPDNVLSFPEAVSRSMEVKYTRLPVEENTATIHAIKSDLTPALTRLNPLICAEVDTAMRKYLPACEDWTEVNINSKLIDVIAQVSGRIFVGPDLCQDPEYLEYGRNYTVYVIEAVNAIKRIRSWLRPFVVPRMQEIKKLRAVEKKAANFMEPIVRERVEAEKNDPNWQKPDDMMQWLLNRTAEHADGAVSVEQIAKIQLGLIFAAVHTTSMTATNILYTLAIMPEYLEPLREEIRNAMHDNGGTITSRALQQMVKLDSYMKEVTRVYPPGLTSFGRRVLKGITLSNGQYIPPGVLIEVPSHAIYSDSAHYPDGEKFDGMRHYKLRQGGTATDHARNQFVTTNESNLAFGYGRHACPGRFFAANEIKMMLARVVLDYDIKMPGDASERHAQIELGTMTMPNPSKTLMFKRVVV